MRGATNAKSGLVKEVTFTRNGNLHSSGFGRIYFDGVQVDGSLQIEPYPITARAETILGTMSIPAKDDAQNRNIGMSLMGVMFTVWVDVSGNLRIYSIDNIGDRDAIIMPIHYTAKEGGGA